MEYKLTRIWAKTAWKLKERSIETGIPATRLLDDLVNKKEEQPKKQQTIPVEKELPKDENDCIAHSWERRCKFDKRGEEYSVFARENIGMAVIIKTAEREI